MKLIYNGIHQRDEAPKAESPAPIHLLFVGRLDYQKGFDVLLKAFAKVQRSDLKLTVVGSAVNEDTVECPEMDAVEYLPWVTPAEVQALYQQADALIVPSRWELRHGAAGRHGHGLAGDRQQLHVTARTGHP